MDINLPDMAGVNLPANIEELHQFILIGKEKLKVHQAKIRAIDKVGMAESARKAALQDGQDAAQAVIYAESKLGELLKAIPKPKFDKPINGSLRKTTDTLPTGISKATSHQAQTIASNPQIVEKAIAKAIEKEKIPTPDYVYKLIKTEARQENIQNQKKEIEERSTIDLTGNYDVVVVDPPWAYGREYDPDGSRVANPYPEMIQTELLKLEIPFSNDCVLFLWTTHAFIWCAKELLDKWGFTYKAAIVWDKEKMGMGAWLRMQCEFCLIGIKGKPFFNNTKWRDIIREPRREHSRKPDIFYNMVDEITAGRKLDYFSRTERNGWDSYGNDTERF